MDILMHGIKIGPKDGTTYVYKCWPYVVLFSRVCPAVFNLLCSVCLFVYYTAEPLKVETWK